MKSPENCSRRLSASPRLFYGTFFPLNLPYTADKRIRNGPAGVFEFENFAKGSKATLDACIDAASNGSTVIIGT